MLSTQSFCGRLVGFEPTIFWATTRRVNPYTTAAMYVRNAIITAVNRQISSTGANHLPLVPNPSTITPMQEELIVLNERYELLERIGSGGMAAVYKARDRALGRIVAVKMLHDSLISDEGFLKRFQQEAHAAANLSHPNIVTIHDIGQEGYRHYIVMEFVEGRTLKQLIRDEAENGRFLPVSRALDLTIQICAGIGYAHRAGLVHCDVKPQNVIVTPDERVKVADFGIARAVSSATQQQLVSQVWGTPQYFAPEQASGEPASPATDVYAIGIVLFEMLTGRLPFQAESHTAMALKHLTEPPPAVTEFNPGVPAQLEQIILKVLSKEPAGRYRTAGQLGRILTTYRQRSLADTGPVAAVSAPGEETIVTPVAEQKTQIYERPFQERPSSEQPFREQLSSPTTSTDETSGRAPVRPAPSEATAVHIAAARQAETDWTAVSLGIAAIVALLGLIPLWWMVYLAWMP